MTAHASRHSLINSLARLRSGIADLLTAALLCAALLGCQSSSREVYRGPTPPLPTIVHTGVQTKESQAAMTPRKALEELKQGNARFVSGHPLARDFPAQVRASAGGQYPFAVVLSCLDSRQPIEIVLDQGIGDVFSARVAGNVVDDDILGSMEFACKARGAKLIAVIGHTDCGAIKGAIDDVQLGNLTGLLAKIKPAADQVPAEVQPRTSKNMRFVDQVAAANVRRVMSEIPQRSPLLKEMLDQHQIAIVGGMYDLSTGQVHFFDAEAR